MYNDDEKKILQEFAEAETNVKYWKKIVDSLKDTVRGIVLQFGTVKEKTSTISVEGYDIKATRKSSTVLVEDIVYRIKALPELHHILKYSLLISYPKIIQLAKEVARGRLGEEPTQGDIMQVVKELTETYSTGVGVDEQAFAEAITNQTISASEARKLFVESEGTPAVSVSKSKADKPK